MMKRSFDSGLSLVEVVIATSIILTFLVALFAVHNTYLRTAFFTSKTVKAAYLAQEALEAVRFLRNENWDANILPLSLNTEYELAFASNDWSLAQTDTLIDDIYDRKVVFSSVNRGIDGKITTSGGTLDHETLKVVVNISWFRDKATTTKSVSTYITNIFSADE